VSIRDVREQPEQAFDISFQLQSGPNSVRVFGEIKSILSPRLLEEIAPWIRRLKSLRGEHDFERQFRADFALGLRCLKILRGYFRENTSPGLLLYEEFLVADKPLDRSATTS